MCVATSHELAYFLFLINEQEFFKWWELNRFTTRSEPGIKQEANAAYLKNKDMVALCKQTNGEAVTSSPR